MNDYELETKGLRLVADHIRRVQEHMQYIQSRLNIRAVIHDQSKYSDEERGLVLGKPSLDKYEYMSKEERSALEALQDSLKHHYAVNSHHPEHFITYACGACFKEYPKGTYKCPECGYDVWEQQEGVLGMSLLDLIEMVCDWKAASEMSPNGSFKGSIEYSKERFKLSPELMRIIENTGRELGWIK